MTESYNIRGFDKLCDKSVAGCEPDDLGYYSFKNAQGKQKRFFLIDHETFQQLEIFVKNQQQAGFKVTHGESTETMPVFKRSYDKHFGVVYEPQDFAGIINFKKGKSLQIWPRFSPEDNLDNKNWDVEKKTFLQMLRVVINAPLIELESSSVSAERINIFEPIIEHFNQLVDELAGKGLKKDYLPHEDNEHFLKGKLQITKHIKTNYARQDIFYVSYDEFSPNRPENRLIKATLEFLLTKTHSNGTKHHLNNTLLKYFGDIEASANYKNDVRACKHDRSMNAYEDVLKWCEVLLMGDSFSNVEGNNTAITLLFSMETVYEEYVARLVAKAAAQQGWQASAQKEDTLFDRFEHDYHLKPWRYAESKKERNSLERFSIRPDIVLAKQSEQCIILDTKWKFIRNRSNHDGIKGEDMYQMYVYQHRFAARKAILVYPLQRDEPKSNETLEHKDGLRASYKSYRRDSSGAYLLDKDGNEIIDAHTQIFLFDLQHPKESAQRLVNLAIEG